MICLCFEGLVASVALLSVTPLADFLLDSSLQDPSRITSRVLLWLEPLQIMPSFSVFAGIFVLANFLKGLLDCLLHYSILKIKYDLIQGLSVQSLKLFLQARWSFFCGSEQGKLLNTFNRELSVIGDALAGLTTQFSRIVQLGIYLAVPIWLDPFLTLSIVGLVMIISLPFFLLHRISYKLGQANTETANILMSILNESLSAAHLILGFATQNKTTKSYNDAYTRHASAAIRSQTMNWMIHDMFLPLGIGAAMLGIGFSLGKGNNLAEMAAVLWSLLRAIPLMAELLKTNIMITNFLPSYDQLIKLRAKAKAVKEIQGAKEFKQLTQGVTLQKVTFSYQAVNQTINDVSMEINKNQMTALVGASGAGKSTISDLLLGLQIPDCGEILLDGIPLSNWRQNSFREKFGFVPQDPQLFNSSVRENLLWSFEKATDEEIWEVCRIANAEEFLRKLPDGLDTQVGDRGVRLSGGQRQRIALARALLRKPELLILDEATSALDSESEKLIQLSIEKLASKVTMLVIAHRLSTVIKAEKIYVMDQGKVIESGNFEELKASPESLFVRMLNIQQLYNE